MIKEQNNGCLWIINIGAAGHSLLFYSLNINYYLFNRLSYLVSSRVAGWFSYIVFLIGFSI